MTIVAFSSAVPAQDGSADVNIVHSIEQQPEISKPGWLVEWMYVFLKYVLFPFAVFVINGATALISAIFVAEGETSDGKFRRLVGALLPIIILSAIVTM